MSYTPGGDIISAGGRGGSVFFMSAQTGEKILCPLTVDSGLLGVQSISFSPVGGMIAAGCYNGKIYLVDALTGQVKRSVTGHCDSDTVWGVCFSPDGSKIRLPAAALTRPSGCGMHKQEKILSRQDADNANFWVSIIIQAYSTR